MGLSAFNRAREQAEKKAQEKEAEPELTETVHPKQENESDDEQPARRGRKPRA